MFKLRYSFENGNQNWKLRNQKKNAEAVSKAMKRPEVREKLRETSKNAWKDPIKRKRMLVGIKKRPPISNETKEKMASSRLKWLMTHKHPTTGLKFSDDINKKKGRIGKNNAMSRPEIKAKQQLAVRTYGKQWKGGISYEPYGQEFTPALKREIRKSYNNTCVLCNGKTKYKIHCHHMDYNKMNNTKENFVTLCRKCHTITNWNRNFWSSILKRFAVAGGEAK